MGPDQPPPVRINSTDLLYRKIKNPFQREVRAVGHLKIPLRRQPRGQQQHGQARSSSRLRSQAIAGTGFGPIKDQVVGQMPMARALGKSHSPRQ